MDFLNETHASALMESIWMLKVIQPRRLCLQISFLLLLSFHFFQYRGTIENCNGKFCLRYVSSKCQHCKNIYHCNLISHAKIAFKLNGTWASVKFFQTHPKRFRRKILRGDRIILDLLDKIKSYLCWYFLVTQWKYFILPLWIFEPIRWGGKEKLKRKHIVTIVS